MLIERHRATLDKALEAIRTREYWSPYPEHPKAYGDGETGKAAFDALLHARLDLDQPGTDGWTGGEVSPYGIELGVEYPHPDPDILLPAMRGRHPRLAGRGPRAAGSGLPGDPGPDQRADQRVRARGDAHLGPGLHDGLPGRRPACAGPGP